jgi:hypothetical protein
MNYAFETGSVSMIYIPSLLKIGSGNRKLVERDTQTHREDGDRISLF